MRIMRTKVLLHLAVSMTIKTVAGENDQWTADSHGMGTEPVTA